MLADLPLLVLAITISTYWGTVLLLSIHKRIMHGKSSGLLPKHRYERRLWRIIAPVVLLWIALPWLAAGRTASWLQTPAWASDNEILFGLRAGAATVGVVLYLLSLISWLSLGRSWSMAIVPGQKTQLVTGGIYGWVRHPIYALSIGLMVCSAVVVMNLPMTIVACFHFIGMTLKARHEERYLEESFGPDYVQYCQRVGRFWPRLMGTKQVRV
jgi:protein-S-isoprenylcysteine O-methyltransferase Ste14